MVKSPFNFAFPLSAKCIYDAAIFVHVSDIPPDFLNEDKQGGGRHEK